MIHQDPRAYLIGLQGVALLHGFAGRYDREFTQARLAEIRWLLDADEQVGSAVDSPELSVQDAYDSWSSTYDEQDNPLLDLEEPYVREIVDTLPAGIVLDAACGTGRHAAHLVESGHTVIGLDRSPGMLAKARANVPAAAFSVADLHRLPVADASVDLVVCGIALAHVPDVAPVLTEFARVLRPGGHLVISESDGLSIDTIGNPLPHRGPDGRIGLVTQRRHHAADYVSAALAAGLQVRGCVEPRHAEPVVDPTQTPLPPVAGEPPFIWGLHPWCADAVNAAYRDRSIATIWHFQRS